MAVDKFRFAEAYTEFTIKDTAFRKGIKDIRGSLVQLQKRLDAAAVHARRFLLVAGGALATFVKFAADAEEAASRFNAVFRDQAAGVKRWSDELGDSVGRSGRAIRDTIASFQAFFVGLGHGSTEAVVLSKKMQALAIDFGSFNNLSDAEAAQRFGVVGFV
jgi:hypothetical protein